MKKKALLEAEELAALVARDCLRCGLCLKDCSFLAEHGHPGDIAKAWLASRDCFEEAYHCSLCEFCTALCPVDLPMAEMFLALRRKTYARGGGRHRQHLPLLFFEAMGRFSLFTYLHLPPGGQTVFFPGCALPGIRPHHTLALYDSLKKTLPGLGLLLDCCGKPGHDLGREDKFFKNFRRLERKLKKHRINHLVTACPSCLQLFWRYGFKASLAWEHLKSWPSPGQERGLVVVHDPCVLRFSENLQETVRGLILATGARLEEMPHSRVKTLCCGEGGGTGAFKKGAGHGWRKMRVKEALDIPMVTSCAGCTSTLAAAPVCHLLDLLYPAEKLPVKPPSSLRRFYNRLMVKLRLIAGKKRD